MTNPTSKWDRIPVFGVWMRSNDESPIGGQLSMMLSQRVTRTDGRVVYPEGASMSVTIGDSLTQDATIRSTVKAAWRAIDEAAAGVDFDGVGWDAWWDTKVVPAAIFTSFPASDDPDIVETGFQVLVKENLTNGSGKSYYIQPMLAMLDQAIPGINLAAIAIPPGTPVTPAPIYQKGAAGGVASLDSTGKVPSTQLKHPIWTGTDVEYAAIVTKDPNTLYFTHA